jgi:predicted O-methyltransferase YrrM
MKYSDNFVKPDYTVGPYPKAHSVGGESVPPDGDAQPRMSGDILLAKNDPMAVGLSYGPGGHNGDFGPYIQRHGEGLPNSFSLDFTNDMKYSAGNVHAHTALILFSLALNVRPKNIIETGTFYGYSTMFLAKACEIWGDGTVYTIDTNQDLIEESIKNHKHIECVHGSSLDVLPELLTKLEEVHFAFIDSWKRIAFSEFRLIEPYMAEGGIFVFHDTQFLNTGRSLYNAIMQNYRDTYDIMLFTAFPHKDNGHEFFGNCDDRGMLVIRKKPTVDHFYDVGDYNTRGFGARLI